MDNSTAHSTTSTSVVSPSYVDDYSPPASVPQASPIAEEKTVLEPVSYTPPAATSDSSNYYAPVEPDIPMSSTSDTVPPVSPSTPIATSGQPATSQELEDQNIFTMLGVKDGTPEQRETFLDELQQVIWEDFLEYDVKLLTTQEEQIELNKLITAQGMSELEKQEKIVVYLEKLIPDLEEIMLEKALELKEEMVRERIKGLREFYANNTAALSKVDEGEKLMNEGKWASGVNTLNTIA